jgi:hypothetical protein
MGGGGEGWAQMDNEEIEETEADVSLVNKTVDPDSYIDLYSFDPDSGVHYM